MFYKWLSHPATPFGMWHSDWTNYLIGEVGLHEYLLYFVTYKHNPELIAYGARYVWTYQQEYQQQVQQLETDSRNLTLPGPKLVEI